MPVPSTSQMLACASEQRESAAHASSVPLCTAAALKEGAAARMIHSRLVAAAACRHAAAPAGRCVPEGTPCRLTKLMDHMPLAPDTASRLPNVPAGSRSSFSSSSWPGARLDSEAADSSCAASSTVACAGVHAACAGQHDRQQQHEQQQHGQQLVMCEGTVACCQPTMKQISASAAQGARATILCRCRCRCAAAAQRLQLPPSPWPPTASARPSTTRRVRSWRSMLTTAAAARARASARCPSVLWRSKQAAAAAARVHRVSERAERAAAAVGACWHAC